MGYSMKLVDIQTTGSTEALYVSLRSFCWTCCHS
jgi:hypothetical protein